jgi:hypothetical protein
VTLAVIEFCAQRGVRLADKCDLTGLRLYR